MGENLKSQGVLFLDADNTLWDTNGVYSEAQMRLLSRIENQVGKVADASDRLAYLRAFDQGLAERHHAGLRYPPRFLIKALSMALTGMDERDAIRRSWSGGQDDAQLPNDFVDQAEELYFQDLRQIPRLRLGVLEGLPRLSQQPISLRIVTEGSRDRVKKVVQDHGIDSWFSQIIEIQKNQPTFARIFAAAGSPLFALMVGDQLDRDIQPAKAAGLGTIYFPGAFRPKWEAREMDVRPKYTISTFSEVPDIVMRELFRTND